MFVLCCCVVLMQLILKWCYSKTMITFGGQQQRSIIRSSHEGVPGSVPLSARKIDPPPKIAQAGGRTWDLLFFVYFLSLKLWLRRLGYCAPLPSLYVWLSTQSNIRFSTFQFPGLKAGKENQSCFFHRKLERWKKQSSHSWHLFSIPTRCSFFREFLLKVVVTGST